MFTRNILLSFTVVLAVIAVLLGAALYLVSTNSTSVSAPQTSATTSNSAVDFEIVEFDSLTEIEVLADGEVVVSEAWVTNPSTGEQQYVKLYEPSLKDIWPVVVMIPGGTGDSTHFEHPVLTEDGPGDIPPVMLAQEGFVVVTYDPLGTGVSEGELNFQGYDDQDGLAQIIRAVASLPQSDPDNIGLSSYSYGVTGAAGVLARYPELAIKYWSDWEGPTNRYYTTTGCRSRRALSEKETPGSFPCADEDFWAEREAVVFAETLPVDYYWRIQKEEDHVQRSYGHTIAILDAALENPNMPWVKVNNGLLNQSFTEESLPTVTATDKFTELVMPHILKMSQM